MNGNYCVKLVRRMGSTKTLLSGLSENNARCICADLRQLDKKSKFSYMYERVRK
jgi:hypothetical protein